MPDPLEFPWTLRAVIPLVGRQRFSGFRGCVVYELVALSLRHAVGSRGRFPRRCSWLVPSLAAVIRALYDLPKPAAGLRGIDAVRLNGRAFEMVHLPSGKVRTSDIPLFALSIRRKNKRALPCPNEY